MPHYLRNHKVKPETFHKRVRSYSRDRPLLALAAQSAHDVQVTRDAARNDPQARLAQVRQGMLFAVAGICVTRGTRHRSKPVGPSDIQDLVDGYHNVWEPELDGVRDDAALRVVLSHKANVQFPFQLPPLESLARSLCLYGGDPRFGRAVFDEDDMQAMLGISLSRLLYLGFAMYTFAVHREGRLSRSELMGETGEPIFAPFSATSALDVIDRWLSAPPDRLACIGRQMTPEPDDLWGFNPLYERPIVTIGGEYVVPCPAAILQRLSPQGLFFVVRDALKSGADPQRAFRAFTDRLGRRFERYIGEQLGLLEQAIVTPEITYDSDQRSVDYIVETPEVVVLVEAKSIAPTLDTRAGRFPEGSDVAEKLQHACDQVARTANLLERGHEDFPGLDGRPMRGLVVTREPYFWLDTPFFEEVVQPRAVPTTFIGSYELESVLPALIDDTACGERLLGALPGDFTSVGSRLRDLPQGGNPLVLQTWDEKFLAVIEEAQPDP